MVLKYVLRYILNERVVNRVADSYLVRRAAKWVVYRLLKVKSTTEEYKALNEQDKLNYLNRTFLNIWHRIQSLQKSTLPLKGRKTDQPPKDYTDISVGKHTGPVNKEQDVEEKLRKYIEELKRRGKET